MPKRETELVNGETYHITMRGVDGRQIFIDNEDRWRGVFGLYEFNNAKSVTIRKQREKRRKFKESRKSLSGELSKNCNPGKFDRVPVSAELFGGSSSEPSETSEVEIDQRERLVDILAFVFMPNHIHLLLRQICTNGLSFFVRKFGVGFAMYFNSRYERKGTLFQGRFEAKLISDDEYLKTAFVYVHTNPISLIEPKWKENGINDPLAAIKFLEEYRWSSYPDYLGKKNFPSVSDREFISQVFGNRKIMKKFVDEWILSKKLTG